MRFIANFAGLGKLQQQKRDVASIGICDKNARVHKLVDHKLVNSRVFG